jgi:hypothetical protein
MMILMIHTVTEERAKAVLETPLFLNTTKATAALMAASRKLIMGMVVVMRKYKAIPIAIVNVNTPENK